MPVFGYGQMAMAARTLGRTKTAPFCLILPTPAPNSASRASESRQKTGFSTEFCLLPRPNPAPADHKVDKKQTVLSNFVYSRTKIQLARLRSRQKMRFPTEFCLPLRPNPHTAPKYADRIRPPLSTPILKICTKKDRTQCPASFHYSVKRPFPS